MMSPAWYPAIGMLAGGLFGVGVHVGWRLWRNREWRCPNCGVMSVFPDACSACLEPRPTQAKDTPEGSP